MIREGPRQADPKALPILRQGSGSDGGLEASHDPSQGLRGRWRLRIAERSLPLPHIPSNFSIGRPDGQDPYVRRAGAPNGKLVSALDMVGEIRWLTQISLTGGASSARPRRDHLLRGERWRERTRSGRAGAPAHRRAGRGPRCGSGGGGLRNGRERSKGGRERCRCPRPSARPPDLAPPL